MSLIVVFGIYVEFYNEEVHNIYCKQNRVELTTSVGGLDGCAHTRQEI
jgi:hypothetical protein